MLLVYVAASPSVESAVAPRRKLVSGVVDESTG